MRGRRAAHGLPLHRRDPRRLVAGVPARWPPSISAWTTQFRNVSGLIPFVCRSAPTPRPDRWVTPRLDRHPRRPLAQLVRVLPRCRRASHPLVGGEPPSIPGRDSSRRLRVADITYCRTFARLAAEGPLAAAQQVGGGHGVVDREPQHRRVLSGTPPESRRPPPPRWVTGAGGLSTVSRGRPDGRRRRSGRPS